MRCHIRLGPSLFIFIVARHGCSLSKHAYILLYFSNHLSCAVQERPPTGAEKAVQTSYWTVQTCVPRGHRFSATFLEPLLMHAQNIAVRSLAAKPAKKILPSDATRPWAVTSVATVHGTLGFGQGRLRICGSYLAAHALLLRSAKLFWRQMRWQGFSLLYL